VRFWAFRTTKIADAQPAAKASPSAKRKNPLPGRGRGLYVFKEYWRDLGFEERDSYEIPEQDWRLEATSAESAARTFIRQFAWDRRTPEEMERYWRDEDQYKAYRGPIKIGVMTCEYDDEEVYQGFRHPDPTEPEPPRNLTQERGYEITLQCDAVEREWRKNWRDGRPPAGAPPCNAIF
jgi:hypothetical protein